MLLPLLQNNLLTVRMYTLAVATGNYSLTGKAVNFLYQRIISVNSGSYLYTGNTVTLKLTRVIVGETATYVLVGKVVTTTKLNKPKDKRLRRRGLFYP
mgnify:FL=1